MEGGLAVPQERQGRDVSSPCVSHADCDSPCVQGGKSGHAS